MLLDPGSERETLGVAHDVLDRDSLAIEHPDVDSDHLGRRFDRCWLRFDLVRERLHGADDSRRNVRSDLVQASATAGD